MTTPNSLASESTPERAGITTLIEQLQASCSWKPIGQWRAYLCAVLYGIIAAIQGTQFFLVYCGILVVVFMLQGFSEQRTRRQIDLLVQLVKELEKKKET
ncbi:MAG TPA: hypothetical protein VMF08_22485 [Candidatus Sulfotelmatobacter sp.]|nr:hypothetical protein [Candidatus Sulfotelmatobacter sp.]